MRAWGAEEVKHRKTHFTQRSTETRTTIHTGARKPECPKQLCTSESNQVLIDLFCEVHDHTLATNNTTDDSCCCTWSDIDGRNCPKELECPPGSHENYLVGRRRGQRLPVGKDTPSPGGVRGAACRMLSNFQEHSELCRCDDAHDIKFSTQYSMIPTPVLPNYRNQKSFHTASFEHVAIIQHRSLCIYFSGPFFVIIVYARDLIYARD